MIDMNEHDTELEQRLREHYDGLYGTPSSAKETWERIAPRLARMVQPVPWWKQILPMKGHLAAGVSPLPGGHPFQKPSLRFAMIVALVIGCVMVAGTVTYAALGSGSLNNLLELWGLKPITQQFSDYHQSKSIDGYTITIQKVYADSNCVWIGFTSEAPSQGNANSKFAFSLMKLTTNAGVTLPFIVGTSNITATAGNLFSFDASSVTRGNPKEIFLHLAIPYGWQDQSSPFHVSGHLTFDFSAPFHPGKVVQVHQSVTAAGKTVTLDHVVITAAETRVYIQGFGYDPGLNSDLSVDGQTYHAATSGIMPHGVWYVDFTVPALANKKGLWTLTIQDEVVLFNKQTGRYDSVPVPGEKWVFQFDVS